MASELIHESFVETASCRVRVWRGGEGCTLLVISDCGDPLELWTGAFEALARDYEVVLVEQPGFGYSDVSGAFDYRWAAHLDALRSTVDQLGIANALGLGHCVGGTQLLAIDAAEPGRLNGALLAETFPADRYRAMGIGMAMHKLARLPGVGELLLHAGGGRGVRSGARYLLRALSASPEWVTDEVVEQHVGPVLAGHNRAGGLAHVRRWDGHVARAIEESSLLPAAYLLGEGGHFARFLPERRAYAARTGRALDVMPGVGHFLYAEQPNAFAARAGRLLAELQSPSR